MMTFAAVAPFESCDYGREQWSEYDDFDGRHKTGLRYRLTSSTAIITTTEVNDENG